MNNRIKLQIVSDLIKIVKGIFVGYLFGIQPSDEMKSKLNYVCDNIDSLHNFPPDLTQLANKQLKISSFLSYLEKPISLSITILTIVLLRSCFYENYKVPTGSMRPTIKEQDHLAVSKTAFGLINPFTQCQWRYDKSLIQRGQVVAFTSDGLDISDPYMPVFGLFNIKKRFVKRLIAKDGDYVFFDGGRAVTMDTNLKDVSIHDKEYCPTVHFGGKMQWKDTSQQILIASYFNIPWIEIQIINGIIKNYKNIGINEDLLPFGIDRFAMVNIEESNGSYSLEILHHPTFNVGKYTINDSKSPFLLQKSTLKLSISQLERLKQALYTCRFVVEGELAHREFETAEYVTLKGVPNGTYEFEKGVAYQIGLFGHRIKLDKKHPIYSDILFSTMFVKGMEWKNSGYFSHNKVPLRYAYFKDDNLCVMNTVVAYKTEPNLLEFVSKENRRSEDFYYAPFIPPIEGPYQNNGELNVSFMLKHALKIPKNKVLMLGDNHAGSGDSRDFGMVDETMLHGTVQVMLWPPSSILNQPADAKFVPNRFSIIMWLLLSLVLTMPKIRRYVWKRVIINHRPWNKL